MAEIIITGASGGIGSALCRVFLDAGHRVMAVSRKPASFDAHPNLEWTQSSLSNVKLIGNAADRWSEEKGLRILIHNAGHMVRKSFEETGESDLLESMRVNFIDPWLLTASLMNWLVGGTIGHVVYISSMSGFQGSLKYPGLAAYGASKGAGNAWVEAMASEFGSNGSLYFNALALGAVDTPMLGNAILDSSPGVDAMDMARFIANFALEGYRVLNGVIVPVRTGNP